MRVVVTGGAGFIGSHVCEALLERGDEVYCLDNFNDYYIKMAGPQFAGRKRNNILEVKRHRHQRLLTVRDVDFTDIDALYDAMPVHVDAVIHLGAQAGVRTPFSRESYFEINVDGTQNVLEAGWWSDAKQFIVASSSSVYGTNREVPFKEAHEIHTSRMKAPYAKSKARVEEICADFRSDFEEAYVACLRFFTVIGERGRPDMAADQFLRAVRHGRPIKQYGDGSSARDYTYKGDIVDGIMRLLVRQTEFEHYEILNLGNSTPVTLNQFIGTIEDVVGKKAIIEHVPANENDVPITYADITKARKLLGWQPKTSVKEALTRQYQWILNSPESSF